ncbi:hypothetical protein PJ985_10840 [Streptomyces sp. ACA25]|uniref:hypothetical protein n=1 Tax=Streptomyces sp. ACA25 TaxID=3022596 RepID=UPI002307C69B|nr:hypothetical protein [Streptomyces sp. ACA25]MDB1088061.1 hypothetical protein [Streptomyces sp. ACA25]
MDSATGCPVLVVGGTGMLAGVVRELSRRGHPLAVLARDATRLQEVTEAAGGRDRVHPMQVNYADAEALRPRLEATLAEVGPFCAAVLWVRTPHRRPVYATVARCLAEEAVVVDVLGSSTRLPRDIQPEVPEPFRRPGVVYRQTVLGFADSPEGTRWLHHEEIVEGVLDTLDGPGASVVVGRLHPWEDRPAD